MNHGPLGTAPPRGRSEFWPWAWFVTFWAMALITIVVVAKL